MKSKFIPILHASLILSGTGLSNTLFQLDFSTGAGTQAGWEAIGGLGSPSGTFSGYAGLAEAGNITVNLANISFDRLYKNGFTGPADDFPETELDAMYSDLLFRNNDAATVDVTIGGLLAGTYQITTHHLNAPNTPSVFDFKVQDADSPGFGQLVGNFPMGLGNTTTFNPTVLSFEVVSNGSDPIILRMDATFIGTGGNTGGWFGINGLEIIPAPAAAPFQLTITPNENPGLYDFQWNSQEGMVYDLVSSIDFSSPPEDWLVWEGQADLAGAPPINTLTAIAGGGNPRRFFAVVEKEIPPLLSEDFESGLPATWAATDNGAGTSWSVGTPNGTSTEPDAAANGTQCAGTNMNGNYTNSASASLVSPSLVVPAGGATLSFSQYIDTEAATGGQDFGSIRLLNASDNSPLAGGEVATDLQGISEAWTSESLPLPAAANGLEVKIEFLFQSDDDGENFTGFYIDDVSVLAN